MQNLDIALKNLKIGGRLPLETLPLLPVATHLFVWCKHGSFLYFSGEKTYIARQNQLALLPAGQVRWVHPLPENPLSVFVFPIYAECHDTDLFAFFGLTSDSLVIDMPPESFQEIYKGMRTTELLTSEELRSLTLNTYAAQLCTFYAKERMESTADENPFRAVFAFMETHLAEDISLDALSALTHYNPVYFSQKFKEIAGVSPIKHLALLRIQNAVRLLLTTSDSVPKVGAASGFQSAYYFRTFFGKYVGLSPDDFRRKYKKGDV